MIVDGPNYSTVCKADEYVGSVRYVNNQEIVIADVYVFINGLDVQQVMLQCIDYEKVITVKTAILSSFQGQHAVRQLLLEKGTLIWKS